MCTYQWYTCTNNIFSQTTRKTSTHNTETRGRCPHRRQDGILRFQLDSDVCRADLHHNPRKHVVHVYVRRMVLLTQNRARSQARFMYLQAGKERSLTVVTILTRHLFHRAIRRVDLIHYLVQHVALLPGQRQRDAPQRHRSRRRASSYRSEAADARRVPPVRRLTSYQPRTWPAYRSRKSRPSHRRARPSR
jgi:hypothetical protein